VGQTGGEPLWGGAGQATLPPLAASCRERDKEGGQGGFWAPPSQDREGSLKYGKGGSRLPMLISWSLLCSDTTKALRRPCTIPFILTVM